MSRFNVSQGTASSFEIKSFIFYILLLVVSIPALSISVASSHLLIGGVGILWGLFGLHRFIPLTATSSATPKRSQGQSGILSLPLRLLYRFSAQEDATRQLIKRRFAKTDMIFIIFLTFSYLTWNVYCSLSPNHFSSLSTLWSQQDLFFGANTPSLFHLQNFMMSFIQVIILLMAGASAVSFVHSRQLTHIFLKLVTPFLLIGFVSALSFSPTADKVVGLDIELLKGIGWYSHELIGLLHPDFLSASGTSFVIRFIQSGFVGTAFLYALTLPVTFMLLIHLKNKERGKIPALLGIFFLVLLIVLDTNFIQNTLIKSIEFLSIVTIMLCCARAGYYSK